MASVVDELNELLARERGEVEALKALTDSLRQRDPDLVPGAEDAMETASWSCSGLYHRINQLGGKPTLEVSNLPDRVANQDDTKGKLKTVCASQRQDLRILKSLLRHEELDDATRSFLKDLLASHEVAADWCSSALSEWEPDVSV